MATIVERICKGELEAAIVYQSEQVIAFADHDPINFGHVLICPVKPYHSLPDLPDAVHHEIQRVAKCLYAAIDAKYSPAGISFIQNNGACNELDHYHLHIFPRFNDDQFGWTCSEIGIQSIDSLRESMQGLSVALSD